MLDMYGAVYSRGLFLLHCCLGAHVSPVLKNYFSVEFGLIAVDFYFTWEGILHLYIELD